MKELYYIGEVSEVLNISTQTLRYYDKIGILQPAYVDPNTGYRRYTYDQISYADRIRHLQNLGLSLEEIRAAIDSNSVDTLITSLRKKVEETRNTIRQLEELTENLDRYIRYYEYAEENNFGALPSRYREPDRYILVEPIQNDNQTYGIGHRLLQRKNSRMYKNLQYLRQNGYLLDYEKLMQGELVPTHYFMYLHGNPDFTSKYILQLPAGDYFCLRTKLLADPLPVDTLQQYKGLFPAEPLVIANEYEDNFVDFKECPYEIQILMKEEPKR